MYVSLYDDIFFLESDDSQVVPNFDLQTKCHSHVVVDLCSPGRYSSGNVERLPYHVTSQAPVVRYRPVTPVVSQQVPEAGEPLAMTSSSRGGPPIVYNHHLHHHHHHHNQGAAIGFQMTSFSSLYVEGGLQELVYGEGAASSGVRTAAAMYRRAAGHGSAGALHAAHLHYTATTAAAAAAGIKKEPRDLGYDVTGMCLHIVHYISE